jgi:coenzyme F420-0:L-glutamate ligase/coenzyme F420-1:gamma-L-glutamate ligase
MANSARAREVHFTALKTLPEVRAGDDLAAMISQAAAHEHYHWPADVIVVVGQKIVSKSEGQVVDLRTVQPPEEALQAAKELGRDPRLVSVILAESRRVVRKQNGALIVETHQGWVCANAGIDQSNVPDQDSVTLLPRDPDASAERLRDGLLALGIPVAGIVISDTFGRPWRNGLANVAIGVAGFASLEDYRGRCDRHGRLLKGTIIAVADELSSAAELLMGKDSGIPVVMVSGLRLKGTSGSAR